MAFEELNSSNLESLPIRVQGKIAELYIESLVKIKRLTDRGEDERGKEVLNRLEKIKQYIDKDGNDLLKWELEGELDELEVLLKKLG